MTDWPKLTIMLLTYSPSKSVEEPRHLYARQTLQSALEHIEYSGQISVHIADDGSPEEHRRALYKIAGGYKHVKGVSVSNSERQGYGANYNLATQVVHGFADDGVVLPLEDDWVIPQRAGQEHSLELDPMVAALMTGQTGCIRLGYLGFTQQLGGRIMNIADRQYLALDPRSPELHVFAGHPRLETVEWERSVGPWPVGHDPGTTEFIVSGYMQARLGVTWPLWLYGAFVHIGTVQAREDQQ